LKEERTSKQKEVNFLGGGVWAGEIQTAFTNLEKLADGGFYSTVEKGRGFVGGWNEGGLGGEG